MMEVAAPHIRRIIAIGMYCGPRIGPSELFRLRWADVDLDAAQLNMPSASKADGPDGRFVPLRGDLVALMRGWQDEDSAFPPSCRKNRPWPPVFGGHFFCHLADFLHFFVYDNAALSYR